MICLAWHFLKNSYKVVPPKLCLFDISTVFYRKFKLAKLLVSTNLGINTIDGDFPVQSPLIPSGYLTVCHGKSPFLIGKPSISMGHLYHGYVSHNQRVDVILSWISQRFL